MVDKLEEAFSKTTLLLFGKSLSPMEKYGEWLGQRVPGGKRVSSCFGTGEVYLPDYGCFKKMPPAKTASYEDLEKSNKPLIKDVGDISLADIRMAVRAGGYFVPTYAQGSNINVEDSFGYLDCQNVKHAFDPFTSKNSAYALSILDADGSFGLYRCKAPKFSIHLYHAWKTQRCFEMDSVNNCMDSMFCHNVENLSNCIFCFNTKSKRYAIGNVEVGREQYSEFRVKLCTEIVRQLESSCSVAFDIYDILGAKQ